MDFLQGKVLLKEDELVLADTALKKKTLFLFYFSSDECEACRQFDHKLREVYCEAVYRRIELAVIIVSTDSSLENSRNNILKNYQDCFALQCDDDLNHFLIFNFGVTHTPTVIVVRKNGTIVSREGKNDIEKHGINALVVWSE